MSDVPKFVRQRLAQKVPGEHPEANLLAAFAEDGLTRHERDQVLAHLSACAACRETVALALPEMPSAPAATPSGAQWARWPMLRWAGLAAAVVVVAAAVVVQNSRRPAEAPKPSAAPAAKTEATAPPPVSSPRINEFGPSFDDRTAANIPAPRRDARPKEEHSGSKKKDAFSATNVNGALAQNKVEASNGPGQAQVRSESGGMMKMGRAQSQSARVADMTTGGIAASEPKQQQQAVAPAPQVPSTAAESVQIVGQSDAVDKEKSTAPDKAHSEFDSLSGDRATSTGVHAQAATAARGPEVSGGPVTSPTVAASSMTMMKAMLVSPQWRLSAEGALERSIDSGTTWHLVQVATPPTTLRTFSALGRDVWAGGNRGLLYHSGDGGRTWTRVTVKAADVVLNSDIVRVEFTDPQRGSLKAASGEIWSTNDAGVTWTVRR